MHVKHSYAPAIIGLPQQQAHNAAMASKARRKTYLREWRRSKPGRTLAVVAEHLHMSQPQLGRIEVGDQPYNQDLLEALADLYGCTVPDLLIRDPNKPDAMWSVWDQASEGQKVVIAAAAEAIVRTGTDG